MNENRIVRRFITPMWTVTIHCAAGTPRRELFELHSSTPGIYTVRVEFRAYAGGLAAVTLALREATVRSRDYYNTELDRHCMPAIRDAVNLACDDARAFATKLRRNAPRTISRRK